MFRVMQFSDSTNQYCKTLLSEIMRYNVNDTSHIPAIQWGIKHESTALTAFLKEYKKTHNAVEVFTPGLTTHKMFPYIRASPDAVISCACHGAQIIEVKCPFKIRHLRPGQAVAEKKIDYLTVRNDGKLELVKKT